MEPEKIITLTTVSEDGTQNTMEVYVRHIKQIIELKGYGARLYILKDLDEILSSLDVIETKEEVQSLIISLK